MIGNFQDEKKKCLYGCGCRQACSITNKKSINGTEKEKGRGRAGCPRREDG